MITGCSSASIPWHALAFVGAMLALCIHHFPIVMEESLDEEIANRETLLHVVFPQYLTSVQIGIIRVTFGLIMIGDSLYQLVFGYWDQRTDYPLPGSKLKPVVIPFRGLYYCGNLFRGCLTLSSFTYWAWILEGLTFLVIGSLPIAIQLFDYEPSPWMYKLGILCWEMAAPISMLVSTVVKYVLWPAALRSGDKVNLVLLRNYMTLLEHNFNFIACLVEVTLLGGLPLRYLDLPLAPLFGILYVLFSYAMKDYWTDSCHGPQFLYPFFDTTVGWWHTLSLLVLLCFLSLFHVLFCFFHHVLTEYIGGELSSHCMAVAIGILLVCRFHD